MLHLIQCLFLGIVQFVRLFDFNNNICCMWRCSCSQCMGLHCQLLELFGHANAEALGSNSLLSLPSCLFSFRLICICLDCCYNDSDNICKLNPIDKITCRCREGAWWNRREPQANLESNHDNPVSGTLKAPSHWDLQWRNAHILT